MCVVEITDNVLPTMLTQTHSSITLRQLRVFVAVGEREHITLAATDLRMAQSATSSNIVALETALGAKLFARHGRNVRLTQVGRNLLPKAAQVLSLVDDLVSSAQPLLLS